MITYLTKDILLKAAGWCKTCGPTVDSYRLQSVLADPTAGNEQLHHDVLSFFFKTLDTSIF